MKGLDTAKTAVAEREGFEPSVGLNTPHTLSRRAPSTGSATSPHQSRTILQRGLRVKP